MLQEDLQGLRVVRAFSGEAREAARYGAINHELRDLNLGVIDAVANNFPFVNFCANLGTIAVVGFGGLQVFRHHLTLGELIAFNSYLGFLLMPIMTIGFLAAMISRAGASALRVFELLDAPLEVTDAPGATRAAAGRSVASSSSDVHFRYAGSEREILRGVSFTAEPGQMVALLGTTGAGKSTVINLIPRFYDVTGGAVLVDGHDVRAVTLSSLRAQIGVVLQEALLFSGTVRDNIAYGRPDATLERGPRRRRGRAGARVHRGAAAGLRHGHRRARRRALGRAAAAHRHRARAAHQAAAAHPRRQHLGRRRRDRDGHPGRARPPDARLALHRVRHRAAHLARCATPI